MWNTPLIIFLIIGLGIPILLAMYQLLTLMTGDFIKVLALKLYGTFKSLTKPKAA